MARMGRTAGMLDMRVPPFHKEFSDSGNWPAQCNIPKAKEFLLYAYENARGAPQQESALMKGTLRDQPPDDLYFVSKPVHLA